MRLNDIGTSNRTVSNRRTSAIRQLRRRTLFCPRSQSPLELAQYSHDTPWFQQIQALAHEHAEKNTAFRETKRETRLGEC